MFCHADNCARPMPFTAGLHGWDIDWAIVVPVAKPGRRLQYKGHDLPVPDDLEILTCPRCGHEWMTPDDAKRIDAAMEQVFIEKVGTNG